MGKFTVKSKVNLDELTIGQELPESDYAALTDKGNFVQLQYHEEEEKKAEPYPVSPGIYTIIKTMVGLTLQETSFVKDKILEEFVNTKDTESKVECFFKNLHKYKEWGIEVPKRAMMLYGPAGTGKSTAIGKICGKYAGNKDTAIVIFPTDQLDAYAVKEFIKSFEYKSVEKFILVMEDIGGVERDEGRMGSDSGLLSLLDNQEKAFKIPTLVIATTNYPHIFMGNITNRPGRFDDKIKIGHPDAKARTALLKFFSRDKIENEDQVFSLLESTKCKEFSPAHIREAIIRSAIYDKPLLDTINAMIAEIASFNKGFNESSGVKLYE